MIDQRVFYRLDRPAHQAGGRLEGWIWGWGWRAVGTLEEEGQASSNGRRSRAIFLWRILLRLQALAEVSVCVQARPGLCAIARPAAFNRTPRASIDRACLVGRIMEDEACLARRLWKTTHHTPRHRIIITSPAPLRSFTARTPYLPNENRPGQEDAAGDRDSITPGDAEWPAAAARGG